MKVHTIIVRGAMRRFAGELRSRLMTWLAREDRHWAI